MLFEPGEVPLRDVLVDGDLDEIRRRQLGHRVADERQERTGDVPLVRTQVRQQAAHQPRVVGLAEDFFFVERHGCRGTGPAYEAASSSSSSCFLYNSA